MKKLKSTGRESKQAVKQAFILNSSLMRMEVLVWVLIAQGKLYYQANT